MHRRDSIRTPLLTAMAAGLVGVAMPWAFDPEAASGPLKKRRPARDTNVWGASALSSPPPDEYIQRLEMNVELYDHVVRIRFVVRGS